MKCVVKSRPRATMGAYFARVIPLLLLICGPLAELALGRPPTHSTAPVMDVELSRDDTLVGQAIGSGAVPLTNTRVALQQRGREVARSLTAPDGSFSIRGVRPGRYEIAVGANRRTCRVWAPNTAPPASRRAALVVPDRQVIRRRGSTSSYQSTESSTTSLTVAADGQYRPRPSGRSSYPLRPASP